MARLAPQGPFRQFTNDGVPLDGGKLYTYESGTVTPKATYTTAAESSANTNPVILDANGRANVWLDAGSYTWVLKTSADVTIWSQDDISAESPSAFGSSIVTVSTNLSISEVYSNAFIVCTATLTLSLLDAATAGEGFYFVIKNTGTGIVTIDPSGSQTIDGASTITILKNESAVIFCDGTNWVSVLKSPVPFVPASATTSAYLDFAEDTDNGVNRARVIAPAALAADADITLPAATGTLATLAGTETLTNKALQDSTTTIVDNADATKKLAFECSGITTATTRTLTVPDASGTVALLSTQTVIQTVRTQTGAAATGSTALPLDNTTPQNTEGTQFITLAITPTSATNKLRIRALGYFTVAAAGPIGMALFQDTTANALAAATNFIDTDTYPTGVMLEHEMVAGTTSATTFKIRAGNSGGGVIGFNATTAGTGYFNGLIPSFIQIDEIKA